MSDAAGKSFDIGVSVTTGSTNNWKTYTNDYGYYFTASGTTVTANQTSTLGLNAVWTGSGGNVTNSFSLTKDYALGAYGTLVSGFSSGEGMFIYGNKHSINASGATNFYLNSSNNYLIVQGVGEYDYSTGTVKASWNGNGALQLTSDYGIFELKGSGSKVILTDSVFYNNKGTDGGAVLSVNSGTYSYINNSVFVSNSASDSTHMAVYSSIKASIAYLQLPISLFKSNSSAGYGGAVSTNSNSILSITGTTFEGNSAGTHGGAIYTSGITTITDSTFINNTATNGGGANS